MISQLINLLATACEQETTASRIRGLTKRLVPPNDVITPRKEGKLDPILTAKALLVSSLKWRSALQKSHSENREDKRSGSDRPTVSSVDNDGKRIDLPKYCS